MGKTFTVQPGHVQRHGKFMTLDGQPVITRGVWVARGMFALLGVLLFGAGLYFLEPREFMLSFVLLCLVLLPVFALGIVFWAYVLLKPSSVEYAHMGHGVAQQDLRVTRTMSLIALVCVGTCCAFVIYVHWSTLAWWL